MFRRNKNRKRSTSRTQNGNKKNRSVRVEKLQNRELMAADFGFGNLGNVFGPQQLPINQPAEVASATAGQTSNATTGQTQPSYSLMRGQLTITGTPLHDTVKITGVENGLLRVF